MTSPASRVLSGLDDIRPWLEELYQHLHANPELSMAEFETAARVVAEVEAIRAESGATIEVVEKIATTGVGVVVRNGDGPTVLMRADMDGLPVAEDTGLEYASTVRTVNGDGETMPVMHACGHDSHVSTLLGALRLLCCSREEWSGMFVAVFQPAEEQYNGAEAMVADGLVDRLPRPDVALGQHLLPGPAGSVQVAPGPIMASCDEMRITLRGRGGHGSAPHTAIDPIAMAASLVLRLQMIVSRQTNPQIPAVITVGRIVSGTKTNIIPETAVMDGTIRAYSRTTRDELLAAIRRTANAEAAAWGAPEPTVEFFDSLPVTDNSPEAAATVREALVAELGEGAVRVFTPEMGSEDFSELPNAWGIPYCYWGFGAFDAAAWAESEARGTAERDFPNNHEAQFAPVLQPTLDTGVRAMVAATLAWVGRD